MSTTKQTELWADLSEQSPKGEEEEEEQAEYKKPTL